MRVCGGGVILSSGTRVSLVTVSLVTVGLIDSHSGKLGACVCVCGGGVILSSGTRVSLVTAWLSPGWLSLYQVVRWIFVTVTPAYHTHTHVSHSMIRMYSKKTPIKRKLTFWDTQPKSSKKPKVSSSPVLTAFKQTASTSVKTVNLESYKREIEHLDPALLQTSQYDLYLVSKLGLYATHSLAAALNHVPKSWPKRQETITNIVTAALEIDKHPIPDNLRGLMTFTWLANLVCMPHIP